MVPRPSPRIHRVSIATGRGVNVTRRLSLVFLALLLSLGMYGSLQGKSRAPETELVLLYHSDTKGEIEECG
jgi:hypothetical protein